jgi:alpha-L-rhamnosidase
MKPIIRLFFIMHFVIVMSIGAIGQNSPQVNPELLNKPWPAKWITCPGISGSEYGVYLFRKTFVLNSNSKEFIIHVSADNRYKLYVNGIYVCNGPARGDFMKWRFETVDISAYLSKGINIISAIVWNFASMKPCAQFSGKTGFILQGDAIVEQNINSDRSWYVSKDSAYEPLPVHIEQYYVVGPGEKFSSSKHPWNWNINGFDESKWNHAVEISQGIPLMSTKEYGSVPNYVLTPRTIPFMEMSSQHFAKIRRSNLPDIPLNFLKGDESLTIPANRKVTILFDQNNLTNAYPTLTVSKGASSEIKITYAESLFDDKNEKGNRSDIDKKHIVGNQDIFLTCDGNEQTFQTLWFRTFRYVQLDIETKNQPLTIEKFFGIFTGYPLHENASFTCNDSSYLNIWNVGWRTQRLCAGETFFDCPYY